MTQLYILIPLILFSYLLIIKLVLPMSRGEVPPNGAYGFRTPLTLSDDRIWFIANRVAGQWMFGACVTGILVSGGACVALWSQPLVLVAVLCGVLMAAAILPVFPAHLAALRAKAELEGEE